MSTYTEPWIFVYFTVALGCSPAILEALYAYFYSIETTGERLVKATTDFMRVLDIPKIESPQGCYYAHSWREPGPQDGGHSPLFIGIWGPEDTGLSVIRVGHLYLQLEEHSNPLVELRLVTLRPTPEGFREKRRTYPDFARWFDEFKNRFTELVSWNRGERPGPLFQDPITHQ